MTSLEWSEMGYLSVIYFIVLWMSCLICICLYIMHACGHGCVYIFAQVCGIDGRMCDYMWVFICVLCTCVFAFVWVYVYMCVCVCARVCASWSYISCLRGHKIVWLQYSCANCLAKQALKSKTLHQESLTESKHGMEKNYSTKCRSYKWKHDGTSLD